MFISCIFVPAINCLAKKLAKKQRGDMWREERDQLHVPRRPHHGHRCRAQRPSQQGGPQNHQDGEYDKV